MKIFLNKASMRSLLVAVMILSPIVIPFTLLLSYQFSTYSYDEINRFDQDRVSQISENVDYAFNSLISGGLNLYENIDVQSWLNSSSIDVFTNEGARNTLRRFLATQSFIYSCDLINTRARRVLSTIRPDGSFETFEDQDLLKYIKAQDNPYLAFFSHTIGDKECLALILPASPIRNIDRGFLVMFIDKDLLRSLFIRSGNNQGSEMVVKDSEGNIILESNKNFNWSDFSLEDKISKAANGQFYVTQNQTKWSVSFARMETRDWVVYSMNRLSALSEGINSFRNKLILYFILFYLVLIIVMFWNFLRINKLLYKLSEQIRKRMGKNYEQKKSKIPVPLKIDYSLIDTGIQDIIKKLDETDMALKGQKDVMREEYLRRWILQGNLEKDVEEFLRAESKLLQYRYIFAAVIRLDSYQKFSEQYDFSSRKLMKFAIGNISNELISNEGWWSEAVDMGSDHLVLLIGRDEPMDSYFLSTVRNIGQQVLKWMKLPTSIACSKNCKVKDNDLRLVYDVVLELTMLKFISGEDKVFIEEDFDMFKKNQQPIPDENILDAVINSVRLGKHEKINGKLEPLFGQMQNITYESCKLQLLYIYFTIVKAFSQVVPVKQGSNAENLINRFGTLNEFREWLCCLLVDISKNINANEIPSKKEEIAREIVEFVNDNIQDPMLTQDEIAARLSWSYSYIRHTFKEVFGITLADYILNTRVNMAKNLLETTDLSVTDVAKRSGFQTKSHYFTAFKKLVGMTPNEYREMVKMNI